MDHKLFNKAKILKRFDIFKENSQEIDSKNRQMALSSLLFFSFVMGILFVISVNISAINKAKWFYFSGIILSLILFIILKVFKKCFIKHTVFLAYLVWDLMFIYLLYISVFIFKNSASLSVILFFIVFPLILTDKYYRKMINTSILYISFILFSYFFKNYDSFLLDALNVLLFYVVGTFSGMMNTITKLKDYENRNLLSHERDDYSLVSYDLKIALETQKILSDVVMQIQQETTPNVITGPILNSVFYKLRNIFEADRAFLFTIKGDYLRLSNISSIFESDDKYVINVDYNNFINKEYLEKLSKGKTIYVSDKEKIKEANPELYYTMLDKNINRVMFQPIIRNGVLVAICGLDNPSLDCGESVVRSLKTVSFVISDLIGVVESKKIIEELTYKDALSQIGNRNAYEKFKKEFDSRNDKKNIGVIFADINDLKVTNDKLGHDYGDKLIMEMGKVLRESFNEHNLFRIGGDEFAVIFSEILEDEFFEHINTFREKLEEASVISASIGYKFSRKNIDIEDLVKEADKCMYEEKRIHHKIES